jgi:hypothetical protein
MGETYAVFVGRAEAKLTMASVMAEVEKCILDKVSCKNRNGSWFRSSMEGILAGKTVRRVKIYG